MSAASDRQGRAAFGRPPLRLTGVRKAYGRVVAVDDLDLVVAGGEVVALVGPNGSGKSTILRLAAGLARPDRGAVEVVGAPAGTRAARAATALVPDVPRGLEELSVREHLALARALASLPPEGGMSDAPVGAFGLETLLDVRVGALSRGQRRRVELAAALVADPVLLLVDEATATLDDAAARALGALLRGRAAAGAGVLVATHDLAFVAAFADRAHPLRQGRIVGGGPGRLAGVLVGLARPGVDDGRSVPDGALDGAAVAR